MRRAAFLSLAALCSAIFLFGCSEGRSHQVLAIVLALRGEVFHASRGTDALRTISPGALLGAGESIRLSHAAGLDIALLPGVLLRVSGDSTLMIDQLTLVKDGNETVGGMRQRTAHIRLTQGQATLSLGLPDDATGEVTVETNRVTLKSDSDSLVYIEADNVRSRVLCVRGKIQARDANGRSSFLEQGSFQDWTAQPTKSGIMQADARLQAKSEDVIKTERELKEIDPPEAFHVR